ncbi:MAG: enoyl-CoA hydratase-related protein [Desulfatiglandaceae bacterium]
MTDRIIVEDRDGINHVVLNRPEAYNAFDLDMIRLLSETLVERALNPKVTGVVLSGQGKAFCGGGDLAWINSYGDNPSGAFRELAARFHQAILEIRRMPKPVIAAINGPAAGGGFSMALACDFRIMAASAVLRQAYTSNGLSMDGGGSFTLPRLVGMARALEIAVFDRPMDAEKAYAWGLVTEVVEDGQAVDRADEMCREITRGARASFAASKRLITDSYTTPFEAQLENERSLISWCAGQPEGREGVAAFLQKRKPDFNPKS